MTNAELLANFLAQHRRPYSIDQLADYTGIRLSDLVPLHESAEAAGETREVEPGIYISARAHRGASSPVKFGAQVWKFDIGTAERIMDAIETGSWSSSRTLARHLGYSHQFIAVYLTALMSIDAVGANSEGYQVIDRGNLASLGKNYQPGIIGRLRRAAGLGSGRKPNWEHVPDYKS